MSRLFARIEEFELGGGEASGAPCTRAIDTGDGTLWCVSYCNVTVLRITGAPELSDRSSLGGFLGGKFDLVIFAEKLMQNVCDMYGSCTWLGSIPADIRNYIGVLAFSPPPDRCIRFLQIRVEYNT